MDVERFSHLLWANLTCYHFSLFLNFTPLYIFLIYGVFLNKALHNFERIWLSSIHGQIQTTTNLAKFSLSNQWIENINLICQQNKFSQICHRLVLSLSQTSSPGWDQHMWVWDPCIPGVISQPYIHQEVDDDFHPEKVHLCKLTWNIESPQILVVSNQIWCTISVFPQSVCYIFATPLQIGLLHFV